MRRVVPLLLLLALGACVERRLMIRTDPPGAAVRVNSRAVGTSPVAWPFDHYGAVLVEADLAGHEPEQRVVRLNPPPYQRPVIDFFADVVWPGTIEDVHEVTLTLRPVPELSEAAVDGEAAELAARARKLRAEAGDE